MGDVANSGGRQPPSSFDPPNFEPFERLAAEIEVMRESAVMAQSATPELVASIEEMIKVASEKRDYLRRCSATATKPEAFAFLALLMKAFVNSGMQDSSVFGRLMLDDVMSMSPPIAAVEIACRRWRRKSKFLPAIAELLVELKMAKDQVENTVDFISRLPALRERMARDVGPV
jgi:hypothetical protein